jgi:hypothetical protein
MIRRETIATLRTENGRLLFDPLPKYRALGFDVVDLGQADTVDAKIKGDEMFSQCRLAKRADKQQRLLAKADRLRASLNAA